MLVTFWKKDKCKQTLLFCQQIFLNIIIHDLKIFFVAKFQNLWICTTVCKNPFAVKVGLFPQKDLYRWNPF